VRKPSSKDTKAPSDDADKCINTFALAATPDEPRSSQPVYEDLDNGAAAPAEGEAYEYIRPPKQQRQR